MSSPADSYGTEAGGDDGDSGDVGLLSPVSAGTTVERLTSDRALVDAMVHAEAALLQALVDAGVAPPEAADAAAALTPAKVDPRELALDAVAGGNPVIPLVKVLRAQAGPAAGEWVHHGATSQDILDTALMLVSANVLAQLEFDLARIAATSARLADENRDVPVVARTLTQQAMPTTFGMRTAGWLAAIQDAIRVLRVCALPVSLGGPVGTAAAYGSDGPVVVDAFAARLDLRAPVLAWHTRRTPVLELSAALTQVVEACGKIAADVLVLSQSEVGEVREGNGGGSSSMAHKSNPARSVLVASAARQAPALASVVAGSGVAEQERPGGAWHAEWQPLRILLRLAGGAAEHTAQLLEQLRLDKDAMAANLDRLVMKLGRDPAWVGTQTEHVSVWIDRVLARQKELFG